MMHHRGASTTSTTSTIQTQQQSSSTAVNVVSPPNSGNYPTAVPGRLLKRRRRRKRGGQQQLNNKNSSTIGMAVLLWYCLGVISIASSKVLLRVVSPITLSLQQFVMGAALLKLILMKNGSNTSTNQQQQQDSYFTYAGIFFAMGFLATNLSFAGAAASFVETLKAAEPITSAALAYSWGLEVWSIGQVTSLAGIVAGVVLASQKQSTTSTTDHGWWQSIVFVMVANACFSFRGLFQKLGQKRAAQQQQSQQQDDVHLQFSMQCMGMKILLIPVLMEILASIYRFGVYVPEWENVLEYSLLAVVNGMAFCAYNLASTFLLSRISVVHHAALNCIRRVFAIVVTSLLFGVPITWTMMMGIAIAMSGFLSYTHFKLRQNEQVANDQVLPLNNDNKSSKK